MNRLAQLMESNDGFRQQARNAARMSGQTLPKSSFRDAGEYEAYLDSWLTQEVGEPWPRGCDPEQCPNVAGMFRNIATDLKVKSDPMDGKFAAWNYKTFEVAADTVDGNADALRKALKEG